MYKYSLTNGNNLFMIYLKLIKFNMNHLEEIKKTLEAHNAIQKKALDSQDGLCQALSEASNILIDIKCILEDYKDDDSVAIFKIKELLAVKADTTSTEDLQNGKMLKVARDDLLNACNKLPEEEIMTPEEFRSLIAQVTIERIANYDERKDVYEKILEEYKKNQKI